MGCGPQDLYDRVGLDDKVWREICRRGMSYRELAQEAAISPATAHRVVQGRRPDVETYLRLQAWLADSARVPVIP